MTRRPYSIRWPLLGLTWLAFALRMAGVTAQSLWRDEVDALIFATQPLTELLAMFRQPGQNGPLFFLALRPWLAAVGQSELALRLPSALAGALAVPIFYALVRRVIHDRQPAAIAALLMATAPYLVWYGQEAKMYAALTVLAPASLLLTVEVSRRGGWWRWVSLYVITSLCFYTHLLAALDRARPGIVAGDPAVSALPPAATLAGHRPLSGRADPALPAAAALAGADVVGTCAADRTPVRAAR